MPGRPTPLLTLATLVLATVTVAGCGAPPDYRPDRPEPRPAPASSIATVDPTTPPLAPVTSEPPGGATRSAPVLRPPPPPTSPAPSGRTASPPPAASPTRTAAAVSPPPGCAGDPPATEVVGLLRAEELLPAGASATVTTGPLCARGWQYTVIRVPDRDPLQVITAGEAGGLRLVAAGTEVCTPQVTADAPASIAAIAGCAG